MPCVRNSSYSFIPILSKIQRYFSHGLKRCMWFGYNPQNISYHIILVLTFITFPAFFSFSAMDILSMSICIKCLSSAKNFYSSIKFFMNYLYVLMFWPEYMDMLWIKFLK